jgi:hypothetical protein
MHGGRFRYVKVVNEDGASVTTKVVVKQLCYMPVTTRLKRLYLSEEIVKQMRWHKEGKCDREDTSMAGGHLTSLESCRSGTSRTG